VAVASAGPYASLTSLQTDNHASTPPLSSQQTSPGAARQGTATSHALHITPGRARQGAAPGHTLGITPRKVHQVTAGRSQQTRPGRARQGAAPGHALGITPWRVHQAAAAGRGQQTSRGRMRHGAPGRMPFLPPNQQRQSTEGTILKSITFPKLHRTEPEPFNGPFSRTTRVGRYQKGKTNLDLTEARDGE